MATSKGPVNYLQVTSNLGKVNIRDETDSRDESFLLWNREPTAISDRIIHSMYVSLVREAIAQSKKIKIAHATDSALVDSLILEAGP